MTPASRNISTLTNCQQIGNCFGQHGSSFTEYQPTHILSTDWQFHRSAMAPTSRNISTLTPCQQVGNFFCQPWLQLHGISTHSLSVNRLAMSSVSHGSSVTEYQHTHSLSTDWQFLRSTCLQLHGISAHSLPVNRLAISSVSMVTVSRNNSTLTL